MIRMRHLFNEHGARIYRTCQMSLPFYGDQRSCDTILQRLSRYLQLYDVVLLLSVDILGVIPISRFVIISCVIIIHVWWIQDSRLVEMCLLLSTDTLQCHFATQAFVTLFPNTYNTYTMRYMDNIGSWRMNSRERREN